MNNQQLIRFEKINSEDFFLLNKENDNSKFVFKICGSTKNIYENKIYIKSKMIFCNCQDSKSWAKKYGVICKHSCFVLFKVLRLKINKIEYFKRLIFNNDEIEEIKNSFNSLNLLNYEQDFLSKEYINKFKNLNIDKNNKLSIEKNDIEKFCGICYENIDKSENIINIFQCNVCLKLLHNKCINKWTSMGNNTCPYCRSIIKKKTQSNPNIHYQNLN